MITIEFLVTSSGTGALYTVSTGLARGRRASVYAALGCTAGIVPHLLATVLGYEFGLQYTPSSSRFLKASFTRSTADSPISATT
jgi:threonine/homoserine/homoserine lactone efflux protein